MIVAGLGAAVSSCAYRVLIVDAGNGSCQEHQLNVPPWAEHRARTPEALEFSHRKSGVQGTNLPERELNLVLRTRVRLRGFKVEGVHFLRADVA
jgi:hypothetical protein